MNDRVAFSRRSHKRTGPYPDATTCHGSRSRHRSHRDHSRQTVLGAAYGDRIRRQIARRSTPRRRAFFVRGVLACCFGKVRARLTLCLSSQLCSCPSFGPRESAHRMRRPQRRRGYRIDRGEEPSLRIRRPVRLRLSPVVLFVGCVAVCCHMGDWRARLSGCLLNALGDGASEICGPTPSIVIHRCTSYGGQNGRRNEGQMKLPSATGVRRGPALGRMANWHISRRRCWVRIHPDCMLGRAFSVSHR